MYAGIGCDGFWHLHLHCFLRERWQSDLYSLPPFRPAGSTDATADALARWVPFVVVIALAIVLAVQTWAEYRKRTFEPTLAFKLGDDFDSKEMEVSRLRERMNGDQITPEVAHHWYHYWLRGYYPAGYKYMAAKQKEDPTQWKFVEKLLCATTQIEFEMNKNTTKDLLKGDRLSDFLNEEIGMVSRRPKTP
jgi:hypothetical protein